MLIQFVETLLESGVLVPAIWLSLGFCIAWFILSAKRSVALSPEEAEMLWKVHRQKTQCNATKCKIIRSGGKIVGFKCECGHKHVQKKPLVNTSV